MEQKFGKNSIDIKACASFASARARWWSTARANSWSARATPHDGSASSPRGASNMEGAMGSGASVPSNIFGLSQKIFSFP